MQQIKFAIIIAISAIIFLEPFVKCEDVGLTAKTNTDEEAQTDSYLDNLQRQLMRAWFPPKDGRHVVLIFKILKNGDITDLRIDKTSGILICDKAALNAVVKAAPFKPLPISVAEPIQVRFDFSSSKYLNKKRCWSLNQL